MARPKSTNPRSTRIIVLLTKEEAQLVASAATSAGLSLSEHVRNAALGVSLPSAISRADTTPDIPVVVVDGLPRRKSPCTNRLPKGAYCSHCLETHS